MSEVKFNTKAQVEHLDKLGETLRHIQTCQILNEVDPVFYSEKQQEYILEYATKLSEMARSVFNDPINKHLPVQLLGEIK